MLPGVNAKKKADQEWSAETAYAYILSLLFRIHLLNYFLAHHNGVNTSSGPPKNPTACV